LRLIHPNLDDTVLYTINPDGSHNRQVVPFAVECPHWSPDGSRIAGCGTPTFDNGATIIDPDTGNYRVIPGPDLNITCYVWARRMATQANPTEQPDWGPHPLR
jgi:Tol biopolymer transport system component